MSLYDIAMNDYRFLKHNLGLDFYNNTLPLMQQICEKLLKSVLIDFDLVDIDLPMLRSHKLDRLYETIKAEIEVPFELSVGDLAWLTGFYFDCRYPGDNYIEATKDQEDAALVIVEKVIEFTNQLRRQFNSEQQRLKR